MSNQQQPITAASAILDEQAAGIVASGLGLAIIMGAGIGAVLGVVLDAVMGDLGTGLAIGMAVGVSTAAGLSVMLAASQHPNQ